MCSLTCSLFAACLADQVGLLAEDDVVIKKLALLVERFEEIVNIKVRVT